MLRRLSKILTYVSLSGLAVLIATMGLTQNILTYAGLSVLVILFAAMGFSRKTLTYVCISVLAVLFSAMGFTQTTLFRQTLRSTIYNLVDANLNASVFIGEMKGNLFTGISIDTIAIYVNNAPFLEAGRAVVRYDPLPLWNKHIVLGSITIDHPSVSLIRFADGTWNVDRLAKKKSEPDSTPSPWVVELKNLRVNDGHFRLVDSTSRSNHDLPDSIARRTFNLSNLDIDKLNVELSAAISDQQQSASIKNISFAASREDFTLSHLSGSLSHTTAVSEVKNLLIVTPRSHIEISAKLTSVDALKIKDIASLQFAPVECTLFPSTVAAEDLQRFLPSLDFLRGSVQVECKTEGEFGYLKVKKLHADFNRSMINLEGSVSNLHRPNDLTLNIESKGTSIHPSDVPQLLPFFHIPDFGSAGQLALEFHYVGKPLDFQVTAIAATEAGSMTVNGGLNLTGKTMRYKAQFGGKGVDIGKIFSAASLRSHLDFSGMIEGEGTSIEELNSKASISLDSSSISGIPISHLQTEISGDNKEIRCSANFQFPKGNVALRASLDYASAAAPSYSFDGTFSHFDCATIFGDLHYSSDCTFSLIASGSNFLHEDMTGDLRIGFSHSRFETYTFDTAQAELHVDIDSSGNKTVRLASPIADVTLSGNFTYAGVVDMIMSHAAGVRREYYKQRAAFDSSSTVPMDDQESSVGAPNAGVSLSQNSIQYSFHLKNLEPIGIFFGTNIFNAIGDVKGAIHGNTDTLSAAGSVSITSAKYTMNSGYVVLEGASAEFNIQNLARDNVFEAANSPSLQVRASAATLFAGESFYRNTSVEFSLHNRHSEYSVQCDVDSTIKFGVEGRAQIAPDLYELTFDTFSFSYQGYELDNAGQFSVRVGKSGIAVDSTTLTHQDERLVFGGSVGYSGEVAAFVRLENFALSNIYHFGKSQNFKSNAIAFGGRVNAQGSVNGTMQGPILACDLGVKNFSYRGMEFGFVNSTVHYDKKLAECSVQLSKTPEARGDFELVCNGSLPVDLAFESVESRFSLSGMDMVLKAHNFDISVIDPFIDQIDEMEGTMEGSIHCTGSLDSPSFDGGMELRNTKFLFPMNNMKYQAAGKIELQGNKLSFTTFAAKNLSGDYSSGKIYFGGYITLRGFVPDEYHLRAKGELKVLQESSRNSDQGVYGDLIASTGNEGLSFDGTVSSSRVTGAIYIKQASMTFPSTRESANLVSARYVNVLNIDDTSKASPDTLFGPRLFAYLHSKKEVRSSNDPSFLDGLGYSLTIQTQGIVQIRMIFNPSTNEELFADLNGKLELSKEKNDVRLTGTITASDKSKYTFYKQFDASGTLKFTGKPDNPELDITATYTGSHLKPEAPGQKETTTAPPTEKVVVSLAISGTRYDPKLKIGLSTFDDNNNETVRTGDVESDAISFLLTSTPGSPGKFRDDLTSNDKQGIANSLGGSIGGSLISGFTNTLLSGMMQDFLRANNFTALSNVEILYSGTSPDLRLSGVVGNAYWTFGGKVFNDINNANVSVQWSLGSIIQNDRLRNFMFEVDRKSDPMETIDLRRPTNGARVYYKFAF